MSLRDKTIKGFLWMFSTRFLSQGFKWLVLIQMARLLLPEDFGLIAMASIFIGFLELINELGVGAAIIQKRDVEEEDLNSVFWLSIFFGGLLYVLIFLLAPMIGVFFSSEKLPDVLRVLGLNFVITAFMIVPYSSLTKELSFGGRSKAELLSIIAGGVLAVTMAYSGYGVWSLVYGFIFRNLLMVMFVFWICPWRPKLIFSVKRVRPLLNFGMAIVASRVLWYLYSSSDVLIIAKVVGDKLLGYYSMAFRLTSLPVEQISSLVNSVSFPVFSKLQDDINRLRRYFLKVTKFVSLITFPTMVGLFLVSESLIWVLFTDKWLPMLVPLKVLCVIGFLKSVSTTLPILLNAKGKPYIVVRFNVISIFVLPASFLFGINYGINGVAIAWVAVYPLLLVYLYWYGLKEIELSFYGYIKNIIPSLAGSAFMACVVGVFQLSNGRLYGENMYLELIGSCFLGMISYFLYLFAFHRETITEVLSVFNSLRVANQKTEVVIK